MNTAHKIIKSLAIALAIFIITTMVVLLLSIITLLANIDFLTGKKVNFEQTYNNIEIIDIKTSHSNVYIKEGDEFKVDAKDVTSKFTSKEKNGILKINDEKNWLLFWREIGEITIYVPKDYLKKLDVESGAGKINIKDINIEKLEIEQGAGMLTINNIKTKNTEINGGAGKININDSTLNNLELESGVGSVNITSELTGKSLIECGIGEINITLIGEKESYTIKPEKGLGNIRIDSKNYNNNQIYGKGSNQIEIEGGIGSISIDFKKEK